MLFILSPSLPLTPSLFISLSPCTFSLSLSVRSLPLLLASLPQSDLFQGDLYPDTAGSEPSLLAEDWIAGQDAPPILISLSGGYVAPPSKQRDTLRGRPKLPPQSDDSGPAATATPIVKETEVETTAPARVVQETEAVPDRAKEVRAREKLKVKLF